MSDATEDLVEHFFRHEYANLVAVLTRAFGIRRLDLVEDMVQVALLEAMHAWKHTGPPRNPAGWIHTKAKHRILDALRREETFQRAAEELGPSHALRSHVSQAAEIDRWLDDEHLPDSLLRMIFVCCHPTLDRKTQIALTLKTLCGFGIHEIARGLMLPDETVKKRVQRAKKSLADANVEVELPPDADLAARLDVVHDVLYLLFNEGYSTSHGTEPIRDDVCEEAARLCHLLCNSPHATPATKALLALQLFHSARLDARIDDDGAPVLLEDQDRTRWDPRLIHFAHHWFDQSKTDRPTVFHLEAAIARHHCRADSVAATDWTAIVALYDRLLELRPSPLYALNRAIALGQSGQTATALDQLNTLRAAAELRDYFLLDCALARIHELTGDHASAAAAYRAALTKNTAPHHQQLLHKKLANLQV